jgi:peptide/nickel transport system ATP-binding protein
MTPLLEVGDLRVCFDDDVHALRGVSFALDEGETLAIVGESGAGKTTLAHALIGLVQPPQASGSVLLDGRELLGCDERSLRSLRWSTVSIALQGTPFNPVATVGSQVAEPLRERAGMGAAAANRRGAELAEEVLLDPTLLARYPHELSGGERRRATLAMALALDPRLVILDEPLGGLDPDTKVQLIGAIAAIAARRGLALIVISHDLPAAAQLAERAIVMYAGEIMEAGATQPVIERPAHPYSWALVNAYPVMSTTKDLRPIRGRPPDPRDVPPGCPFHPRCTQAEAICGDEHPPLARSRGREVSCHFGGLKTLLTAAGLQKTYRAGDRSVRALQDVSLHLDEGEAIGLVGPSGSGKSTLALILCGHLAADAGEIVLEGRALSTSWRRDTRSRRRRIQLVMQDPWDALSPRLVVEDLVAEPLDFDGQPDEARRRTAVAEMLEAVGLPPSGSFLRAHVHELSGGQLQRIALARALVARPKLLVADEPTSMLDPSEQARLLVVLRELQVEMGLGLILVSHDIAVVRKVTDRVVVLEGGRVVEERRTEVFAAAPASATGRRLVRASPSFSPRAERDDEK